MAKQALAAIKEGTSELLQRELLLGTPLLRWYSTNCIGVCIRWEGRWPALCKYEEYWARQANSSRLEVNEVAKIPKCDKTIAAAHSAHD